MSTLQELSVNTSLFSLDILSSLFSPVHFSFSCVLSSKKEERGVEEELDSAQLLFLKACCPCKCGPSYCFQRIERLFDTAEILEALEVGFCLFFHSLVWL